MAEMTNPVAALFKRAFAAFEPVAKRDPGLSGAVEVDLSKVATEIAKVAALHGPTGAVAEFEKSLNEIGAFLDSVAHDPLTDKIVAAPTEYAKKFTVDVAKEGTTPDQEQYYVAHGSGRAKPGKPGENQYTAGSGVANGKGEEYTQSSTVSSSKTPSGGPGNSFAQTPGGPNGGTKKAATSKAQQPSHNETPGAPGMLLTENLYESQEPMVSEGFGMSAPAKPAKKPLKKNATATTTEALWARDMAEMTKDEVIELRKAAQESETLIIDDITDEDLGIAKAKKGSGGALDGDQDGDSSDEAAPKGEATDDRSAVDAKRKKAKKGGKGKAQFDGPAETVDDLEDENRDAEAAAASKPNTGGDPDESVDTVEGGNKHARAKALTGVDQSGAVDERPEDEDTQKGAQENGDRALGVDPKTHMKPTGKGKKPAFLDDKDDDEDDDKDKTEKSAGESEDEVIWEKDMSPAESPVGKRARMLESEIPTKAHNAYAIRKNVVAVRKAALEPTAEPSGLSPDQVADEARRRAKPADIRQRERVKTLKARGYTQGDGYQPGVVDGIDD